MNIRAFSKEHCALCGEVSLFDSNGCRQHPGVFIERPVTTLPGNLFGQTVERAQARQQRATVRMTQLRKRSAGAGRKPTLTATQTAEVVRRASAGESKASIARAFGMSGQGIGVMLKRVGA